MGQVGLTALFGLTFILAWEIALWWESEPCPVCPTEVAFQDQTTTCQVQHQPEAPHCITVLHGMGAGTACYRETMWTVGAETAQVRFSRRIPREE